MSDIQTLMRSANPIPDAKQEFTDDDVKALLTLTMTRSGDMQTQQPQKVEAPIKQRRRGWLIAAAAFAVVMIVGAAVMLSAPTNSVPPATTPAPTPTTIAEAPPTTIAEVAPTALVEATPTTTIDEVTTTVPVPLGPTVAEGLAVATVYMEALMDGDLETAQSLGLDSLASRLLGVSNASVGPRGEVPWQEALGWAATLDECVVIGPDPTRTRVTCTLSHSTDISRALGVDSFNTKHTYTIMYEGGTFLGRAITKPTIVSDGSESDTETASTGYVEFKAEVFDPFILWLEDNHRDDLEQVMWHAVSFGLVSPDRWLTGDFMPDHAPESVDLWRLYSTEYIDQLSN